MPNRFLTYTIGSSFSHMTRMVACLGALGAIALMSGSMVALSSPVAYAADSAQHKELKAYPPAKAGMKRIVIVLPEKTRAEEGAYKVELLPGKTMQTDGVNRMRSGAHLKPHTVKGWGYSYYTLEGASGPVMSTMMAAPGGAKKVSAFVSGKPLLIRYNSRLPIVIYAPKDAEVKYRIWTAPQELSMGKEG